MSLLPEDYIIKSFYEYAGYVQYNRYNHTYNGCCPICHEGKSWGKKKRCFYIPENDIIYCHNCGWSSNPLKWIAQLTNKSYKEIFEESNKDEYISDFKDFSENQIIKEELPSLPGDCINLYDKQQLLYYRHENILQLAVAYLKERRLFTAINKPPALYLCKNDYVHKNRIIIPFFDEHNDIVYYQSRGILPDDLKNKAKYLSKSGTEKSIYGINQINNDNENVFIFEGPIDSFFTENGIAVAGIQENSNKEFNQKQQTQMDSLNLFNKIWVIDSQWKDKAAFNKTKILLDKNEKVFIWPENLGTKYKDFNDICVKNNVNKIPNKFILENSYTGIQGLIKLGQIKTQF